MKFQGKLAIVTGGNGYIGGRICRRLLQGGAQVAVFDLATDKAGSLAEAFDGVIPVEVDVTDEEAVRMAVAEVVERVGTPDFLVTAAGGSARSEMRHFADQRMEVVRRIIEMNLFGALNCIHAVAPLMVKREFGKIVSIASIVAEGGLPGCVDYAAAKGGIIAAMRSLAMELGPHNVTVNCVSPGLVQRPDAMPADPLEFAHRHSVLNRICTADDIAGLVCFLLSTEGDYVTGQNLVMDGGRSLGLKGSC